MPDLSNTEQEKSPTSWRTPPRALELIKHLIPTDRKIIDPCAGEGAIVEWLSDSGFDAVGIEIDKDVAGEGIIVGDWFRLSSEYLPGCGIVATPPTMVAHLFMESTQHCDFAAYLVVPMVGYQFRPNKVIDAGMVNDTPMQWRVFSRSAI
jgi:hypothetical protein